MPDTRAGEGPRPMPDEEDGPPGTSRNPITGEIRDRHLIGGENQHELDDEPADTDTVTEYHGVAASPTAPKET